MKTETVYLIHFSKKLHHSQHYIGVTKDVEKRLLRHMNNPTSKIMIAARANGIDFQVSRIWTNAKRGLERLLKQRKHGPKLCPICNPNWKNYGHVDMD